MVPALPFKHLKHSDVIRVEWIALDPLQVHGFLPQGFGFCDLGIS